jgi:S-methylmethionine-dependent homocysteine/selenocysteine methylase
LRRGVPTPLPLWSAPANVDKPAKVEQIHRDYIRAGCRLISTNTFRTTLYAMERAGKREAWFQWNQRAVDIAKSAAGNDAWVLGSVSTLEDCYRPDLAPRTDVQLKYHNAQIDHLVKNGVDGLLLETFNTVEELDSAFEAASRHSVPVLTSVVLKAGDQLYDGTPLAAYARWCKKRKPDAVCLNCASPEILDHGLRILKDAVDLPLGAYANVGKPGGEMGFEFTHTCSPVEYSVWIKRWADMGIRIVGGCCGTTPEYLQAAATVLQTTPRL